MKYKTKGEIVFEQLKEMVFAGKILPGETVSAIEMAKRFGVSRSPVNEAIKRLSDLGLVNILPSVGFEIRTLPCKDVVDLNEIRYRLEILAVERIENLEKPLDISPLTGALEGIKGAIKEKNHVAYNKAARDFHLTLIQLADSKPLEKLYSLSWDYGSNADTRFLKIAEDQEVAVEDHRRLAEALATGEFETARAILSAHKTKIQGRLYRWMEDKARAE